MRINGMFLANTHMDLGYSELNPELNLSFEN